MTIIKKITIQDVSMLQEISIKTFIETFLDSNSEENMKKYLEVELSLDKLQEELMNSLSEFYFAIQDGEVIGYLKVNMGDAQTEQQDLDALEIERIYVLKSFHGKKNGQLLFDKAIEIAQKNKRTSVWLGVWEKNHKAIAFYEKNGFVEFDRHLFILGEDAQTDLMMKKDL